MICPSCGREQPDAPECAACGLLISKWHPGRRAAPAAVAPAARPLDTAPPTKHYRWWNVSGVFVLSVAAAIASALTTVVLAFDGRGNRDSYVWEFFKVPGGVCVAAGVTWAALSFFYDPSNRRWLLVVGGVGAIAVWHIFLFPVSFFVSMAVILPAMGQTSTGMPPEVKAVCVGLVLAYLAVSLAASWVFSLLTVSAIDAGPSPTWAAGLALISVLMACGILLVTR